MKVLLLGAGLGLGFALYQNRPSYAGTSPAAFGLVVLLVLVLTYLGGFFHGRGNVSATATATAVAVADASAEATGGTAQVVVNIGGQALELASQAVHVATFEDLEARSVAWRQKRELPTVLGELEDGSPVLVEREAVPEWRAPL